MFSESPRYWLPRARGDGPFGGTTHIFGGGFPEYAGMDPGEDAAKRTLAKLPRVRGDRPKSIAALAERTAVSPHMWGWAGVRIEPRSD